MEECGVGKLGYGGPCILEKGHKNHHEAKDGTTWGDEHEETKSQKFVRQFREEIRGFKALIGKFQETTKSNSVLDLAVYLDCLLEHFIEKENELRDKARMKR